MTQPSGPSKAEVREQVRRSLAAAVAAERIERSLSICDHLLKWAPLRKARVVMSFLPAPSEPDLEPLHNRMLADGKTLCLPRMQWEAGSMHAIEVAGVNFPTEVRRHGIREPVGGRIVTGNELDLILVPGLAFDSSGSRLGRGAGFYDRFLGTIRAGDAGPQARRSPLYVGVCFSCQILPGVPRSAGDVPMDAIASEPGVIVCRA